MSDSNTDKSTELPVSDAGDQPSARSGLLIWTRQIFIFVFILLLVFVGFIWHANYAATRAGKGILFDNLEEVPKQKIGLVFGCSDNLYFKYRIEAAVELYRAGKVEMLIVSGLREKYYNEPDKMRKALVLAGVPAENILCDYAGLRTLDSVLRANKTFGYNDLTLVSQKFQNERAAYIAQANKIRVYGYNARDVEGYAARKTEDREVLARVKMWLDVNITNKQPRYLEQTPVY